MPVENQQDISKLNYDGEMTLEALATLHTYIRTCCNKSATAKKLNKKYFQVRKYLNYPYVRDIFKLYLLQEGITPQKLAQTIAQGIDASHGVYSFGSKVADEPDWSARHKFAQLATEIFEVLKYNYKVDVTQVNNQLNISVNDGEKLVREAASRGIPIPEVLARRYLLAGDPEPVGTE